MQINRIRPTVIVFRLFKILTIDNNHLLLSANYMLEIAINYNYNFDCNYIG